MRLTTLLAAALAAVAAAAADQQPLPSDVDHTRAEAPPYRDELLSLHKALVSIPSVTGAENDVGRFLLEYLRSRSYDALAEDLPPLPNTPPGAKRFNVLAWPPLPGNASTAASRRRPRLLLTSHIDVVPPHIPYGTDGPPGQYGPDTTLSGRGSVDAKASVAAQIVALETLLAAGAVDPADAMLLFVVGEETSGDGMRRFSQLHRGGGGGGGDHRGDAWWFDAVVFGEPTENKLACGHKGHAACTIVATGRAGHSGYPALGKSATALLVRALGRVLDADLGGSARFGNTTVNIGLLEGGVAANVIPDRASATLAFRIAAGDQATGFGLVRERVQDILRETDAEDLGMRCENGYGPIECDCDVEGFESVIVNYGTDAANLEGDHVRYLYGPGSILVAHGDDEALQVRDLEEAVEGYMKLIRHVLGAKDGGGTEEL